MADLISLSECQVVVQNYFEKADRQGLNPSTSATLFKVLNFEVKPYGDDVLGFLGEYFRLIVQIERHVSEELGEGDDDQLMANSGLFSRQRSLRDRFSSSRCQ